MLANLKNYNQNLQNLINDPGNASTSPVPPKPLKPATLQTPTSAKTNVLQKKKKTGILGYLSNLI